MEAELTLTEESSREIFKVLEEQDKIFMEALLNGERGFTLKCSDGRSVELVPQHRQEGWIPCSERLPSEEERKEWIDNNLDGIGYLYPCLVTRYSSINPDRTKNNPYVAKHYFDGEDFVNCGEEVCSEYILAWMPLPEPWKGADDAK